MEGTLIQADGKTVDATVDLVRQPIAAGDFLWLDLEGVDDEASQLLRDDFGFHPLAVEDAEHFRQRPKIDDFENFTYFVVHGAKADDPSSTLELHLFYSDKRIVTVHQGAQGRLAEARARLTRHNASELTPLSVSVLYVVVDTLVDSFFPVLSVFDDASTRSRTRSSNCRPRSSSVSSST
ncbi:MAG: hypothetical protein JOZ68_18700 [Acidimicrobiia bacterium]|nr:hypothetical protein [Acidimicrobiia bacterium]